MKGLVDVLHRVANADRLRILNVLAHANLCGRDLEVILELRQSAISRHLAVLRSAKLVRARREGPRVRYSLARSQPLSYPLAAFLQNLLVLSPDLRRDLERLKEYWDRGRLSSQPWRDPLGGTPLWPDQDAAREVYSPGSVLSPGSTETPRPSGGQT
jgi:DNA-binding transcriptional ArsR family regulator